MGPEKNGTDVAAVAQSIVERDRLARNLARFWTSLVCPSFNNFESRPFPFILILKGVNKDILDLCHWKKNSMYFIAHSFSYLVVLP
jgi:hypothetical protein